jgi:hypothetical protein
VSFNDLERIAAGLVVPLSRYAANKRKGDRIWLGSEKIARTEVQIGRRLAATRPTLLVAVSIVGWRFQPVSPRYVGEDTGDLALG